MPAKEKGRGGYPRPFESGEALATGQEAAGASAASAAAALIARAATLICEKVVRISSEYHRASGKSMVLWGMVAGILADSAKD
jgi:hypothetical protein